MSFNRKEYLREYQKRYQKRWRQENPDKHAEYMRRWHAEHRESHNAQVRDYYQKHREELVQGMKEYHLRHRFMHNLQMRVHSHKRRKWLEEGDLTEDEWLEVLEHHEHRCAYCGSAKRIEMDHIVPRAKGGTHTKSNVQPLCKKCNRTKGAR